MLHFGDYPVLCRSCFGFVLDFGATSAPTLVTMIANHIKVHDRGRQSFRLDPEVWAAIDMARLRRAGSISRNTWITEAIAEKLAREQDTGGPHPKAGGSHV